MLTDDLMTVAWTAACIALSLYAFHRRDVRRAMVGD
jgi:ABC-type transport system involved in multi-copper enzyme maturation permease subunit